jgi:hypothetical protein
MCSKTLFKNEGTLRFEAASAKLSGNSWRPSAAGAFKTSLLLKRIQQMFLINITDTFQKIIKNVVDKS